MKKIKKLKLLELTSEEKRSILGGCYIDIHGNPQCCFGTDQASMPPMTYPAPTPTPYPGGNPNKPVYCGSTCMPGDKADFANWIGTKLANEYL